MSGFICGVVRVVCDTVPVCCDGCGCVCVYVCVREREREREREGDRRGERGGYQYIPGLPFPLVPALVPLKTK